MTERVRICPNPECPDRAELGEPGEYRVDVSHCPVCGAALVVRTEAALASDPVGTQEDLVPVLKVHNAALLPVAKSLLDAEGIDFLVRHEGVQGLVGWGQIGTGFNPLTGAPEIMVAEHDLDDARAVLDELRLSEAGEEE